jgi:hypothetical protein
LPVVIPIENESGRAFFKQTTSLDGRDYVMRFQFNQRLCRWYLSVFDQDDNPIRVGMLLTANWPVGRTVVDERWPPGLLLVVDTQASDNQHAQDPCLRCLGSRHLLVYYEESELPS